MYGRRFFPMGAPFNHTKAYCLNDAPKGQKRLFLGMLKGDTCVSIPDFLLLCLVIELVTVHTCELIKVSLSRPTA